MSSVLWTICGLGEELTLREARGLAAMLNDLCDAATPADEGTRRVLRAISEAVGEGAVSFLEDAHQTAGVPFDASKVVTMADAQRAAEQLGKLLGERRS